MWVVGVSFFVSVSVSVFVSAVVAFLSSVAAPSGGVGLLCRRCDSKSGLALAG